MKKYPETSKKARSAYGFNKHLRPAGKRLANKATRRIVKVSAPARIPDGRLNAEMECSITATVTQDVRLMLDLPHNKGLTFAKLETMLNTDHASYDLDSGLICDKRGRALARISNRDFTDQQASDFNVTGWEDDE